MPHCCTDGQPRARSSAGRHTRRMSALLKWAFPITALTLVPKCPGCVTAYVLLFTGIGLSISAASAIRWGLILICSTALTVLIAHAAVGLLRRTHT